MRLSTKTFIIILSISLILGLAASCKKTKKNESAAKSTPASTITASAHQHTTAEHSAHSSTEETPVSPASPPTSEPQHQHQPQLTGSPESTPAQTKEKPSAKKTLYHCPMHPNYISDKPGECPICGMTLVPIEEEKHEEMSMEMPEGTIQISPQKQQLLNLTFSQAEYRNLEKTIQTVARFTYDETRLAFINTKFPGWIEELSVDYTGRLVRKGEPLFSIYSPELVSAQEEYLLALKAKQQLQESQTEKSVSTDQDSDRLLEVSKRRLLLWDLKEEQIKKLEESGRPFKSLTIYSPLSGFVVEKNILKGQYVMPGENLYKIADISKLWVLADIYEQDIPLIQLGQETTIEVAAFPGKQFSGKISYIFPYLENETRTVKVRIELPNPDFKLKPEMYGNIKVRVDLGQRLTVPESAVIDSGQRKLVFVDRGNGYLEPRQVEVGITAGDYLEILKGLKAGDRVVTSANFLIDSESRLKSALKKTHQH
ncbi:MAG: efflux RND transporter periplasmic adaptor subunit [Candidatus Aminicenantes bacterium]|nr:efflux RND transporter periplasmic adaptor subunit [Candidatus Aminicenantes bacterium]